MKRTLIVLLLAALGLAASIPATAPTAPEPAAALWETEPEGELEEEDWELELEEACLEEDEELEALCEEELEAEEKPCPLRSASAHAVERHKRTKITIGYTTYEPAAAKVQIRRVGTFKRHLTRSGVLRFSVKRLRKAVIVIRTPESAGCPSRRLVLFPH